MREVHAERQLQLRLKAERAAKLSAAEKAFAEAQLKRVVEEDAAELEKLQALNRDRRAHAEDLKTQVRQNFCVVS
jgi:hypothetical protein